MSCSTKIFVSRKRFSYCITSSLRNLLGMDTICNSFIAPHIERKRGLCVSLSSQGKDEIPSQLPKTEKSSIRKRKSPKASQRHMENIISYFKQCNDTLDVKSIPPKIISKAYSQAESLYVVGQKTADDIAERVVQDDINTPVFELNPGLGVVTEALFKKRVCEVHAFQAIFWDALNKLGINNSDRLFLYKYDYFSLWKRLLLEYYDDQDVMNLLSIVKSKPWKDGPPVKIFAPSIRKVFINHMIAALVFQKGFFQLGRLEFYLAMRPRDYHSVIADGSAGYNAYRGSSVMFQIMFEREILCMLPKKDFIPWIKKLSAKKAKFLPKHLNIYPDYMYLVKITPREDLYEIVQGAQNLKVLWHFVRQCFSVRSNQVIPTLEKWIPGCGPRLIFKNLNIYTEFGELTPSEMLQLFQMFSSWPEYLECSFLDSMDTYFLKSYIESNPDGINEEMYESIEEDIDPEFDEVSDESKTLDKLLK